ncbi:hypothetical protein A3A03_03375 [Candidatus Nomurabacteria bacterium RIFCSPLOWO2_01_FULL_40_18]|uniref:M23ase beta-sheet core domain-containing protein n=1 Tax=Candidatus Nomurabacteria bacterium RIFCSPLOWO2_01_FULL_40_18 TaxID=1801773 RepID=A0A1F6XJZ1_9BACT|nr:MAG: hypothetical protein A3A03_03375 [Candidatus Nomurabacteria bacterium RIFCSPLOWO2_01_FULL_40_18]
MKPYLDYKKLLSPNRALDSHQSLKLCLVLILLLIPLVFSHAETAKEVREKIDQKSVEIAKLEAEIRAYQSELQNLGKQKNSLSVSIKQLDITKKKLNADIAVTQNQIDKTNLQIQNLSNDIGDKESNIENDIESIKIGIQKTNEFELTNVFETLLSSNDFTGVWNDIDNIATVREKLQTNIVDLKQIKGELEDTRTETIKAKDELVALKSKLSDQQKIVVQNTNEKNKLLTQTKNSEANYQKLVADQLAKKLAFEKDLRDYESQLKFILNPDELPGSGVLSWPLDNVYVTQVFGKTVASKRLYVSGSHSGVDFRASIGTPVRAMADGVVLGTGNTDETCVGTSFGKWVFIKYNNGLVSTYGHLSLTKAVEGQKITRGDIVAYSGNTGHTTGPHLHVSLYVGSAASIQKLPIVSVPGCIGRAYTIPLAPTGAYLDPLYYLPNLSSKLISPSGQSAD